MVGHYLGIRYLGLIHELCSEDIDDQWVLRSYLLIYLLKILLVYIVGSRKSVSYQMALMLRDQWYYLGIRYLGLS